MIKPVQHSVHGGHAEDILIPVKTMERAFLQEIPMGAAESVSNADLERKAVIADLFKDKFLAGVCQQDMLIGGDEKAATAAGRVTNCASDSRIDHLDDDTDQVAWRAELGRLFLPPQAHLQDTRTGHLSRRHPCRERRWVR